MNELIAIAKSITIYICTLFAARNALDRCCDFASAAIFKLLNLIARRRIVIPLVNNCAIVNVLIPAVLTMFLLTGESKKYNQGDGNGYSFHNTQNINKGLNSKVRQPGIYVNNC